MDNHDGEHSRPNSLSDAFLIGAGEGATRGGVIGAVLGLPLGFLSLMAALSLSHTSGDQATGAGGLIIFGVPVFAVLGIVLGAGIGGYKSYRNFKRIQVTEVDAEAPK